MPLLSICQLVLHQTQLKSNKSKDFCQIALMDHLRSYLTISRRDAIGDDID
jgi:hypothetical protein